MWTVFFAPVFNPLTYRILTVFGLIRGESVTHRSMGRDAPQDPP